MLKLECGQRLEILRQLREHGESRGLDLVKRSGGKLKRGTVYVVLSRLDDDRLVASRQLPSDGGLPLRVWDLRPDGLRAVYVAEAAREVYEGFDAASVAEWGARFEASAIVE